MSKPSFNNAYIFVAFSSNLFSLKNFNNLPFFIYFHIIKKIDETCLLWWTWYKMRPKRQKCVKKDCAATIFQVGGGKQRYWKISVQNPNSLPEWAQILKTQDSVEWKECGFSLLDFMNPCCGTWYQIQHNVSNEHWTLHSVVMVSQTGLVNHYPTPSLGSYANNNNNNSDEECFGGWSTIISS